MPRVAKYLIVAQFCLTAINQFSHSFVSQQSFIIFIFQKRIEHYRPPATEGTMVIVSVSLTGVASSVRYRMSSSLR